MKQEFMMISLSLFAFLFTQLASIKMNTIPVIVSFSFIARFDENFLFQSQRQKFISSSPKYSRYFPRSELVLWRRP